MPSHANELLILSQGRDVLHLIQYHGPAHTAMKRALDLLEKKLEEDSANLTTTTASTKEKSK
jgi:hypothetical protein